LILIFLLCFLLSVFLSLVLTRWVRDLSVARGWVHAPRLIRHVHTNPVPRLGGVALFISFMIVAGLATLMSRWVGLNPVSTRTAVIIFGSSLMIFILGLYDDLRPVGPYWKFAIQAAAALLLCIGGLGIHQLDLFSLGHPLSRAAGMGLTVIWVLLITNAFNLIDGLDGLAAGSALFSTIILFVTSLFVAHPTVTLLTIALAGVIVGFLRYNFHPASIFLGDSGSMFIGFMLSALALAGTQKGTTMVAVAIPVICFGFPILDVTLSVLRRFLSGKPLFRADNDHIHHRLLKRGLSQRGAVLILYGVTAVFALLSLVLLHDAAFLALVLVAIGIGVGFGVKYLGYAEFSELRNVLRRGAERKRAIANNVEIRRAVQSLNGCTDLQTVCEILRTTLQPVGFDGFRLQELCSQDYAGSLHSSMLTSTNGEIECHWCEVQDSLTMWELKLALHSESHNRLGKLTLVRAGFKDPLLLDMNLLSCEFRMALSAALLRVMREVPLSIKRQSAAARTPSVKVISASSSD
jgi:UDP-GlcNAc:undecaprenyl-phosphate/decaprenyl-phosphate GlcNAc-1-phosphate transferase